MRCRRSNGKINAQWYGKVDTDLLRQAERGGALRAHDPDDRVHAEAANHKVRHALPKNKKKSQQARHTTGDIERAISRYVTHHAAPADSRRHSPRGC